VFRCFIITALLVISGCQDGGPVKEGDWQQYQQNFIDQTGFVMDSGNQNIAHSEGQGVGMLLSVAFDDRKSFDSLWQWSKTHLQVNEADKLFVWRWRQQEPHITDRNNASDGDILIAWALLRAFERWHDESYRVEAEAIIDDIRMKLISFRNGQMLLLPGLYGFEKEGGITVNPSYWIYPALRAFQQHQPEEAAWGGLIQSGMKLSSEVSFGAWKLPPDWLQVAEGEMKPSDQFPKRFGLDAVRIPLYMIWAGYDRQETLYRVQAFWRQFSGDGAWPQWAELETTDVRMASRMQGVHSIALLTDYIVKNKPSGFPDIEWQAIDYYQATLAMLSRLVWQEKQENE